MSQGIDSQEEQFQLLIAARGMIDQLFLTDTAKKVRRGMEGRVLKGYSGGGRCYGYDTRKSEQGAKIQINRKQARIVRRIFGLYADGYSLKGIAKMLNSETVPSPRPQRGRLQRSWAPSAIRHMLLNERYRGFLIWNQKHKVRNPNTGRRVMRPNEATDAIRVQMPDLRIVSDALWERVQDRFRFVREQFSQKPGSGRGAINSPYLFTGILKCGLCGANLNIVTGKGKRGYSKYGCPMHHSRGTCDNGHTERTDVLETRLLDSLQNAVLKREVIEYTLSRFDAELRKRLGNLGDELSELRKRKNTLDEELMRLTQGLAMGDTARPPASIVQAIAEREQELKSISAQLLEAKPDSLESKLAGIREFVVSRLADIRTLLTADTPRAKAELLRHVQRIDVFPTSDGAKRGLVLSGEWDLLGGYDREKVVQFRPPAPHDSILPSSEFDLHWRGADAEGI